MMRWTGTTRTTRTTRTAGGSTATGLLAAGVLALVLAGCGEEGTPVTESSPAGDPPTSAVPTPAAPAPSGGDQATPRFTVRPTDLLPRAEPTAAPITVTGTVAEGVEHGCTVLHADERTYQVTGPLVGSLPRDRPVTVRGTLLQDRVSTCQQGPILRVDHIEG